MGDRAVEPNGSMNGLPAWAKMVGAIGIPGVAMFWLLYLVTGSVAEIRTRQEALLTESRGVLTRLREHDEEMQKIVPLLRAICRHGARNEIQAQHCE